MSSTCLSSTGIKGILTHLLHRTAVGDMAAAIERISEYQTHNAQFCKRISDFLFIMVKFQVSA